MQDMMTTTTTTTLFLHKVNINHTYIYSVTSGSELSEMLGLNRYLIIRTEDHC